MTTNDLLAKLRNDVLSIIDVVKEFESLPESDLNWKEQPSKWSVLECLEHLNRYSHYYNAEIKKSLARGRPSDSTNYVAKSTWMGRKFIAMMHPDNKSKQKTFARMDPVQGSLNKGVIAGFLKNQSELLEILTDASSIDLNKTSVAVEFLKILKMNFGDALQFVVVHEQRHINQAKKSIRNTKASLTPTLTI